MLNLKEYEHRDAWEHACFEYILDALQEALSHRPRASLLVSGGSTPGPIYKRLSGAALPWERVDVALVDERWVANDHSASNTRLIHDTLLIGPAEHARFIHMKSEHTWPCDGVEDIETSYQALAYPFDCVILGMGPDGHTASLFPHAEGLTHALQSQSRVAPIRAVKSDVTGDYVDRMTLTAHAINSARRVLLAITGYAKRDVLKSAQMPPETCDMADAVEALPIRSIIGQDNLDIFWTS